MSADILSDVLAAIRLSGAVFFDVRGSAPWVAEAPPAAVVASYVMPGADHAIEYHVMVEGDAWVGLVDDPGDAIRLSSGSVVMFPHGDAHVLSSSPGMRAEPDADFLRRFKEEGVPIGIRKGGHGHESVRFICGLIGFNIAPFNPLLDSLPRVIHIHGGYNQRAGWLPHLIAGVGEESANERIGKQSTLSRFSELLFIEAVRSHIESMPIESLGWLAALRDHRIEKAVRLMHQNPEKRWTLASLAKETGVSRSLLATLFTETLGVGPMTYLTNWRMLLAANMLTERNMTISRVAFDVGYDSEASFSKAFKRVTSMPPGKWRSRNR